MPTVAQAALERSQRKRPGCRVGSEVAGTWTLLGVSVSFLCMQMYAFNKKSPVSGAFLHGRYWARTSDPQLVELVLSQLS